MTKEYWTVNPSAEKNKLNSLIHLPAAFLMLIDQWFFFSTTMQPVRQPQYNTDSATRHKDH